MNVKRYIYIGFVVKIPNLQKVEAGKEQQLKEKDQTITQLQKKIEDLQKLAISNERPPNVTERRSSMVCSTEVIYIYIYLVQIMNESV